jgi:hypothetical protein
MTLHLGKRPASYRPATLRWADVKASAPTLPTPKPINYSADVPNGYPGWGMLGNGPCDDGSITDTTSYAYNGAGCCAWSGPGHETIELDTNSKRTVGKFTCENILTQYAVNYLKLANLAALNAQNDAGSDVQDVLQYRATTGLLDTAGVAHKIAAYWSIEPGNIADLYMALYLGENVGIGINFPESAMDQFNNNAIWSVVAGAQNDGGHYIPLMGYDGSSTWTCITWGKAQQMTQQFLTTYCDEAYAYISTERYNAVTGETLEDYTDADLEKYFALVGTALGS